MQASQSLFTKKNTYMYTKTHIRLEKSEYRHALTLYIYFSLFSYLLESMEFI